MFPLDKRFREVFKNNDYHFVKYGSLHLIEKLKFLLRGVYSLKSSSTDIDQTWFS